jgi:hypothetical protein
MITIIISHKDQYKRLFEHITRVDVYGHITCLQSLLRILVQQTNFMRENKEITSQIISRRV